MLLLLISKPYDVAIEICKFLGGMRARKTHKGRSN